MIFHQPPRKWNVVIPCHSGRFSLYISNYLLGWWHYHLPRWMANPPKNMQVQANHLMPLATATVSFCGHSAIQSWIEGASISHEQCSENPWNLWVMPLWHPYLPTQNPEFVRSQVAIFHPSPQWSHLVSSHHPATVPPTLTTCKRCGKPWPSILKPKRLKGAWKATRSCVRSLKTRKGGCHKNILAIIS